MKPLVSDTLLTRGFGQGPDFKVCTGAAQADEVVELPVIRMVGSSTVKDLQGDVMALSALQDMSNGNPELTIFIDHSYSLPNDVFGKLYGKPEIHIAGNIADLHLAAAADLSRDEPERYPHSKAWDIYTQIRKGKIRHGSSVGVMVTEYDFLDPDDIFSGVLIHHVNWVEHSIVGIPASQRAWVEQAVKGLFERALVEGRADDAKRLAPAVKSMFWRDYDSMLRYLESEGLRKDLERVRERGAAPQRIMYDFTQSGFVLAGPKEIRKSLTPKEASDLLEHGLTPQTTELDTEDYDPDTTKSACGKTSWPLADIGTEWTGSKAKSEIFEYAGGDDFSPSKAKQGFLYCGDDPKVRSSYKCPFCYKGESGLKIVPLGVRACANVLSGGRGGGSFDDADGAMKSRVKTMYGRINSQFKPDPEWQVPWERDEKSLSTHYEDEMAFMQTLGFEVVEQENTFFVKSADGELIPWLSKGVLDTDNGSELIRQDLEDEVERDEEHKEITIHDDSSHEKSGEEEIDGQADVNLNEDDKDESDQKHLTLNEQRTAEGLDPIVDVVTQNAPTPEQLAYLSLYNDLGKRLGFPEHTLATKCNLVDNSMDAQSVISAVSALDGCADTLFTQAYQVSSTVDMLMSLMKIPDMDGMEAYASLYSLERAATSLALTVKAGKELSGKNASLVQSIHDTAVTLHPACCKGVSGDGTAHQDGATTVQEAQEEARAMGQGQGYDSLASLTAMGVTVKELLNKSFEGLNVKSLVEQKVTDAVDAAMAETRANQELLNREQQLAIQQLARLKNVPLGRPTGLTGRTVVAKDEREATYEEMLAAGGVSEQPGTLAELEAYTEIVEKDIYASGGGRVKSRYRHWPAGVGGTVGAGQRPPLTGNQKSLMLPEEWAAYNIGADCEVPILDDPFAR